MRKRVHTFCLLNSQHPKSPLETQETMRGFKQVRSSKFDLEQVRYVSIRQHTSSYVSIRPALSQTHPCKHTSTYVSTHTHTHTHMEVEGIGSVCLSLTLCPLIDSHIGSRIGSLTKALSHRLSLIGSYIGSHIDSHKCSLWHSDRLSVALTDSLWHMNERTGVLRCGSSRVLTRVRVSWPLRVRSKQELRGLGFFTWACTFCELYVMLLLEPADPADHLDVMEALE